MEVAKFIDPGEVKVLLELLQPTDKVETRAPNQPRIERLTPTPAPAPAPAPRRRAKRRSATYEVVDYSADRRHRSGTWTAAMVIAAITNSNTFDAERWLFENYPQFRGRSIDWNWLADKQNYIRFI
jgi:hypothetical protein